MCVEVVEVAVEVLDDDAAGVLEVVRRVVHLGVVVRLMQHGKEDSNHP